MTIFIVMREAWDEPVAYSTVLNRAITLARQYNAQQYSNRHEVVIREYPLGELDPECLNQYTAEGEKLP